MALFRFFKNNAVRHLDLLCVYSGWATLEEHLVVIVVQNFAGIGCVVLKICDFQYYASFLENAYSHSFWGSL